MRSSIACSLLMFGCVSGEDVELFNGGFLANAGIAEAHLNARRLTEAFAFSLFHFLLCAGRRLCVHNDRNPHSHSLLHSLGGADSNGKI